MSVQEHAGGNERRTLVSIYERMILRDAMGVHGRQLRKAAVVARPCSHHCGLEQARIAKARRATETCDPDRMGFEDVVDLEEENVVETHPGASLPETYFASSANTFAFLFTKRSSASRLREALVSPWSAVRLSSDGCADWAGLDLAVERGEGIEQA
jgi:hypothetical protein